MIYYYYYIIIDRMQPNSSFSYTFPLTRRYTYHTPRRRLFHVGQKM